LVVGANVSARSDLRIFSSDNNVTMQNLNSPNTFRTTCFRVFEKMLDTVPSGVVLSAPIVPRQWILRSGHLDLDNTNAVRYIGAITTHHKTAVAPAQASWFFGTNGGGNTGTQLSDTSCKTSVLLQQNCKANNHQNSPPQRQSHFSTLYRIWSSYRLQLQPNSRPLSLGRHYLQHCACLRAHHIRLLQSPHPLHLYPRL